MNDMPNTPETVIEALEDELDCALVLLGEYQDIGEEDVPLSLVKQLSGGVSPLRAWREHRGMSLSDLATAARVQLSLIARVEDGKDEVSLSTMKAIARALRVQLDDLVPWSQDETSAVGVK